MLIMIAFGTRIIIGPNTFVSPIKIMIIKNVQVKAMLN